MNEHDELKVFNLTSNECYIKDNRHLLEGITFSLSSSDCLGVLATKSDESKILLEELANLRPFYSGYLIYKNAVTPKKTRLALDHIFFIDGTKALIEDMNVLEYMMYVTSKFKTKTIRRQNVIFNLLLEYNLKDISLTKICFLNKEERMLVMLFSTIFSNSRFIIVNLNPFDFSDNAIELLRGVFLKLRETKTVILATTQAKLIGICCNKISYINNGNQRFFGTTLELQQEYDTVMFILHDKNIDELFEKTKAAFPFLDIRKRFGVVMVCAVDGKYITNQAFYQSLSLNNIFPSEIKMNLGRISNAIEELVQNDIQK